MFPNRPKLLKGGIVQMRLDGVVERVIPLQYNAETLSRSLQAQYAENEGDGDRSQMTRLTGPPIETIKLEAVLDATDQLEHPRQNRNALQFGIQPQLAALETILYPSSSDLQRNLERARGGAIEITPIEAPLSIFVWSRSRVAPVRITEFSIEEQFFDPNLNPIRARVSLGMRVLNINDLGISHRGANLYLVYQREKERLAALSQSTDFGPLGIQGLSL